MISKFEAVYAVPMWPLVVVLVGLGIFCYSLSSRDINVFYLILGLAIMLSCFIYFRVSASKSDDKMRACCKDVNKLFGNRGINWEYKSKVVYTGMRHMVIHDLIVSLKDHSE